MTVRVSSIGEATRVAINKAIAVDASPKEAGMQLRARLVLNACNALERENERLRLELERTQAVIADRRFEKFESIARRLRERCAWAGRKAVQASRDRFDTARHVAEAILAVDTLDGEASGVSRVVHLPERLFCGAFRGDHEVCGLPHLHDGDHVPAPRCGAEGPNNQCAGPRGHKNVPRGVDPESVRSFVHQDVVGLSWVDEE